MIMKKFLAIGIVCLCLAVMPAMTQENNTTTNGNETNAVPTPPLPSFEPAEVSAVESSTELTTEPAEAKGSENEKNELPYTYIIIGCLTVIAIAFIALMIRKPPKTEVTVEE